MHIDANLILDYKETIQRVLQKKMDNGQGFSEMLLFIIYYFASTTMTLCHWLSYSIDGW